MEDLASDYGIMDIVMRIVRIPESGILKRGIVFPMSPQSLTREEVRNVDRRAIEDFGVPGVILMENAGRGAAELLLDLGISGTVVICAGKGNNGGDGFVIARHLENHGIDVRVLLFADPVQLQGDARINFEIISKSGTPLTLFSNAIENQSLRNVLAQADWIVDALLGTGTRGNIREPFPAIIEKINQAGTKVFAVDLPSGLDCDAGIPLGVCVQADRTATFVARKVGFDVPGSEAWTGIVDVIDIGVPRQLLISL